MKRTKWFVWTGILAVLVGCGGSPGGVGGPGEVSGAVTDSDGGVVREARVYRGSRETFSNSSGLYVLSQVPTGESVIRAEVFRSGIRYSGQNVTTVFSLERSKNVNIAVVRDSQQAHIHGTVRDRFGNRVQGARVFAYGNALSSNVDITDSNGDYSIRGLQSGIAYLVTASARTFDSDATSATLSAGEDRRIDFNLDDETNPNLPAPQNLSAVAWTSPFEATRSPRDRAGIEAFKQMIDPRRAARAGSSRTTAAGNHIEVDVYWDPMPGQVYYSLLGFGIWRATSPSGQSVPVDFLRDPNAVYFVDAEDTLVENAVYYYEATALNTSYPDTPNSQSAPSNRYGVLTLGDLFLQSVTFGPLTFRWFAASNAQLYEVYLFAEFPSIGVDAIWDTSASPTAATFQVYSGPPLVSGRRYYYIVLGTANGLDSRTISQIGEFVAN